MPLGRAQHPGWPQDDAIFTFVVPALLVSDEARPWGWQRSNPQHRLWARDPHETIALPIPPMDESQPVVPQRRRVNSQQRLWVADHETIALPIPPMDDSQPVVPQKKGVNLQGRVWAHDPHETLALPLPPMDDSQPVVPQRRRTNPQQRLWVSDHETLSLPLPLLDETAPPRGRPIIVRLASKPEDGAIVTAATPQLVADDTPPIVRGKPVPYKAVATLDDGSIVLVAATPMIADDNMPLPIILSVRANLQFDS
jgi:hypothetical protein